MILLLDQRALVRSAVADYDVHEHIQVDTQDNEVG